MIALAMALQLVSAGLRVPVVYDHVPPDVIRVELYVWTGDRPAGREDVVYGSRRFTVNGRPRGLYVAALFRTDGRYLIDGPFEWPDAATTRTVSARWLVTLGGAMPPEIDTAVKMELIRPDPAHRLWPACFADGSRRWSCWGVGAEDRGIVVAYAGNVIWWTTIGATVQDLRSARWGRLLLISGAVSDSAPARVALAHPIAPPPSRMRAMRLDTAPLKDARVVSVSSAAVWIAGEEIPSKAWIEVGTDSAAPVYLPLDGAAEAPPSLPLHVALRERRVVEGRVSAATGEAAGGSLISVFRLIDPPGPGDARVLPRRVIATETVADENGGFALTGLGEANYEVLAWHAQLGRASVGVPPDGTVLNVRLQSSGVARGRVLAGGRAIDGIDVISVPDPAAFAAAGDMTDVKGGNARTGSDGRFTVAIAPSGGGELRIGGGAHPVRRVPLPRSPVPIFDAGDIELGRPISILISIDRDAGCDVRAAGPVGRSGLQIITGTRLPSGLFEVAMPEPGFWEFTLACGRETRPLSPSVVQVGLLDSGREVRMSVR